MTRRLVLMSLSLIAFGIALLGLWPSAGNEANALLLMMLTLQAAGQAAWHWRNTSLSQLFLSASLILNILLICTFLLPESWVGVDHWGDLLINLPGDWHIANIRPPILILFACFGLTTCALLRMRLGFGSAIQLTQVTLLLLFAMMSDASLSVASMVLAGPERITLTSFVSLLLIAQWIDLQPAFMQMWRRNLIPLIISSSITLVCLLAWQQQSQDENNRINQSTYVLGDKIATELSREINDQLNAMRRFAGFWSLMGQTPSRGEWQRLARSYYKDFDYFQNIAFIDPDSVVSRVFPDKGRNHDVLGVRLLDAQPDTPLRNPLELGIEGHTGIIDLIQGGKGMVSYLPVRDPRDGTILGAIAMVVDLAPLLDRAMDTARNEAFAVTLSERGNIYIHVGPESRLAPWGHRIPIELPATDLTLGLQPTQQFLAATRGRLPEVTLLTGMLLAYLLFLVIYMYRRVSQEHGIVKNANDALREEMVRRERLQNEIQWLARHDELTQLPNRRYFLEQVQSFSGKMPLAVMILDIDFFKMINDKLGHLEGDRYLQKIAAVSRAPVESAGGILARFGGEEFVVCIPECPRAVGRTLAEELRRAVQAAGLPQPATDSVVTVSVGMACVARAPLRLDALLQAADEALYRAKSSGRNQVQVAA